MRRKREKVVTAQSLYKDYEELVKTPLSYKEADVALKLLMRKLSNEIIVNKYEWKIPKSGGFLRISKTKKGHFFWYWDKANDYCRIKKKSLWSFSPCRGWLHKETGKRGLIRHYFECKNDKKREDYDVPIIKHLHRIK